MQTRRWLKLSLCLSIAWGASACGGSVPIAPSASAPQQSNQPAAAPQSQPTSGAGAASPAPNAPDAAQSESPVADGKVMAPEKPERPGLATQFGEDLQRSVTHTQFNRESPTEPFATATIWYNDAAGAQSMARSARQRTGDRAQTELFNGGLVVSLVDEHTEVLPGFTADSRLCAIGEANTRYAISIQNRSDFGFEVVASVDGLGVIDGRPAAYAQRGYILYAHQDMLIEGFRTGEQTIAAFRFGKVSQSYSVQMGRGDRNVGVIGVAFFHERGQRPTYTPGDTQLRQDANPFPGEYAPRPKGR